MTERQFGTRHIMDLRSTQVEIDDAVHNVLGAPSILEGAEEPQPLTMCGLRIGDDDVPATPQVTTCERCALLAAYRVMSLR